MLDSNDMPDFVELRNVDIRDLTRSIDEMRAGRREIKIHPTGFLQLSLANDATWRVDGLRLHVWSDMLPRRDPNMGIHEHSFAMTSRILYGELENLDYEVRERLRDDSASHIALEARHSKLHATGERFEVSCVGRKLLRSGELYCVPKGHFHCSVAASPLAVTLILRSNTDARVNPRVLAPVDYSDDDVLASRSVDQSVAWKLVGEAMDFVRREINAAQRAP